MNLTTRLICIVSLVWLAACSAPESEQSIDVSASNPAAEDLLSRLRPGAVWIYDAQSVFPNLFDEATHGAFRVVRHMGAEVLMEFSADNYETRHDMWLTVREAMTSRNDEMFDDLGIWLNLTELQGLAEQADISWVSHWPGYDSPGEAEWLAGIQQDEPFEPHRFNTSLIKHGAAVETHSPSLPQIENLRAVTYPSGELPLQAWLILPEGEGPHPAVIYFHGGFSLSAGDFYDAEAFLKAGYALMLPMLRSENGNPGDFELWHGEIDDAAAASRWLAEQPGINPEEIYAFGHSVGGGVAAGLSLHPDAVLVGTAGSGGLYLPEVFEHWSDTTPFALDDVREQRARLLFSNQRAMRRWHIAYLGEEDNAFRSARWVRSAATTAARSLRAKTLPGDHWTSLPLAIDQFIAHIAVNR